MNRLTRLAQWQALKAHRQAWKGRHLRDVFAQELRRFERFSAVLDDLLLDYSKNLISAETLTLLRDLGRATGVEARVAAMFRGEPVNNTEQRAALHVALRNDPGVPIYVQGENVMPEVAQVLARMERFTRTVRSGRWKGHTGAAITDVVNIGIGGSDLGPAMACRALVPYGHKRLRMHFVSNVDPQHLGDTLAPLKAESTLFIVASKTFTTLETLANAQAARRWLLKTLRDKSAVARHFVAVSTNRAEVEKFGIDPEHMFGFWDWVGGRYSLWSAIGLPIALYVGMDGFRELLAGGRDMDAHFRADPLASLPGTLGLLAIWYQHFWGASAHGVMPYDQHLARFPAYLQQLCMESNGKGVTRAGQAVACDTGEIVWGEPGTNGQHAFFQLLHQGTRFIPLDFLVAARTHADLDGQHQMLVANCLAQSEALMRGKTRAEAAAELAAAGLPAREVRRLAPHKTFPGNRPSNTLLYGQLTPRTLGRLIALYEHKVLVQSAVWDINAFDQWGVELGKQLAGTLIRELGGVRPGAHDASTMGLMRQYLKLRTPR